MKKFLLGSVALAAISIGASANAADMAVRRAAPPPAFSWTGCHLGGLVGYEWGRHDGYSADAPSTVAFLGAPGAPPVAIGSIPVGTPITGSFDMDGMLGGGYGGCDFQFGSIVVGVEGDWQAVNKEGQARFIQGASPSGLVSAVPITGITPPTVAGIGAATTFLTNNWLSAKERWIATVRGRVGFAVDKWLFFASGGVAWTQIDTEFFCLGPNFGAGATPANCASEQHDRRTGWTVGGGVEYAPAVLKSHWTVRAEYLYVNLDSYNTLNSPQLVTGSPLSAIPFNVNSGKLDNHIVRFGLAYKFGAYSGSELR
jgi:outer membrane immunogenic protein